MIESRSVSKSYGGVHAVRGLSMQVRQGSITGLIGPNGAGKTTAFDIISGFVAPTAGKVVLDGADITGLAPHERVAIGLCRTFQHSRVFPKLTVRQNVAVAQMKGNSPASLLGQLLPALAPDAAPYLELVGLHTKQDERAGKLSYGQQKLLELARCLATGPKAVLLDEPFAGVNPLMIGQIKSAIRRINRTGVTFLLIEHNLSAVMELCDHVIVMDAGEKLAEGTPAKVRSDKKVIDAYLGVRKGGHGSK